MRGFSTIAAIAVCLCACIAPIFDSIEKGRIDEVNSYLAVPGNSAAQTPDPSGWTLLHQAVKSDRYEIAQLLIARGADVRAKTVNGTTPLGLAVYRKGPTAVALTRLLLEHGAVPPRRELFDVVAMDGDAETAKLLIAHGVDLDSVAYVENSDPSKSCNLSALGRAATLGREDLVRLLLESGADPFAGDDPAACADKYGQGATASLIRRFRAKNSARPGAAGSTVDVGLSKEDIKNIVQAAVKDATQPRKAEDRGATASDIDRPAFDASQVVMGDDDVAVIVGIEGYQDLPKSDYSYDDAKLVKEYAKALGFKERNIELLLDERATKSAFDKTFQIWLKNKTKPDSRVFVYYSGHGAPDPASGDAYLVPYDGDPNYLSATGYPLKKLYADLGALPAKEVFVALDACFSGSGGRSVLAKGARPLVNVRAAAPTAANVVVLSATQGSQISSSSSEKGHGIFTYYFLKALRDGRKDAAGIYEYAAPRVEDEAKQLNVQQRPSLSSPPDAVRGRFLLRN